MIFRREQEQIDALVEQTRVRQPKRNLGEIRTVATILVLRQAIADTNPRAAAPGHMTSLRRALRDAEVEFERSTGLIVDAISPQALQREQRRRQASRG